MSHSLLKKGKQCKIAEELRVDISILYDYMLLHKLTNETHVWHISPESVHDDDMLARFRAMLSSEELTRYRRFRFQRDGHDYLVSHALMRTVLSKYADVAPRDWQFQRNRYGRPEISRSGNLPPLRFNLTHTRGLAACVINLSGDCGIDAERISLRHAPIKVAMRMFSDAEYTELKTLSNRDQLEYFFTRWTLREAYVKALGLGLSFLTRDLTFTIHGEESIEVSTHTGLEPEKQNWQFGLFRPTDEHITAVAIRNDNQLNKTIVTRVIGVHEMSADAWR